MSTRHDKFMNKYRVESARLKNWDYRSNASYFVTICTGNRVLYFGDIINNKMQLSDIGKIADDFWRKIPEHFPFVMIDEYVVMPNHVHGIIVINKSKSEQKIIHPNNKAFFSEQTRIAIPESPKSGTLSVIIRSYKSVVTKYAHKIHSGFSWQSRFYDHIIRDDESYENIRNYIKINPSKWGRSEFRKR